VAGGDKERVALPARSLTRTYQARRQFHDGQVRRRTRDNLIAGIAGGILVLGIVGIQTAYFVAGPGAPAPAPSSTSTPAPSGEPDPSPTPTPTP